MTGKLLPKPVWSSRSAQCSVEAMRRHLPDLQGISLKEGPSCHAYQPSPKAAMPSLDWPSLSEPGRHRTPWWQALGSRTPQQLHQPCQRLQGHVGHFPQTSLPLSFLEVRFTLRSGDAPFFGGLLPISFPTGISLNQILACFISSWCLASASGKSQTHRELWLCSARRFTHCESAWHFQGWSFCWGRPDLQQLLPKGSFSPTAKECPFGGFWQNAPKFTKDSLLWLVGTQVISWPFMSSGIVHFRASGLFFAWLCGTLFCAHTAKYATNGSRDPCAKFLCITPSTLILWSINAGYLGLLELQSRKRF